MEKSIRIEGGRGREGGRREVGEGEMKKEEHEETYSEVDEFM